MQQQGQEIGQSGAQFGDLNLRQLSQEENNGIMPLQGVSNFNLGTNDVGLFNVSPSSPNLFTKNAAQTFLQLENDANNHNNNNNNKHNKNNSGIVGKHESNGKDNNNNSNNETENKIHVTIKVKLMKITMRK